MVVGWAPRWTGQTERTSLLTVGGYTDWLRARHNGGGGKSDLVAFFFRLADSKLASDGAAALIATNSIGQGDTRRTGLKEILAAGSWIYYAKSRLRWPGLANVIVSLVCFSKNKPLFKPVLNGRQQERISAYLTPGDYDRDPDIIPYSKEMAFLGVKVQGMGFVVGGKDKKCTDPLDLEGLLKEYPRYSSFVKGYIGGEHLGRMKTIAYPLKVFDLTDLSKDELDRLEPLRNFLHQRIWIDRKDKTGSLKARWWEFGHTAKDLVQRSSRIERMIVTPRNSDSFAFQFIKTNGLVNDKIVAFPYDSNSLFCVLQSRVHEVWARFLCSTLKDDLQYAPSDCVVNFPFPEGWEASEEMSRLGGQLDSMRSEYIAERYQGVTDFYNDIPSPSVPSRK